MMRFSWILFVVMIGAAHVSGQVRGSHKIKYYLELDFMSGTLQQHYDAVPLTANYLNPVNTAVGTQKYTNIATPGYNAMLGRYFGKKSRIGIQAGIMYCASRGKIGVDTFHVEYESKDYNGNVFRQIITANNGIHETITANNVSIPVLVRYHQKITDVISLTLDAGPVFNVQMQNNYVADARFDYEAIYQIEGTGTKLTYHYDNAPKPGPEDWLITRTEFMKDNPKGIIQDYFNGLKDVGFNVGLTQQVKTKTGVVDYNQKTIGYMGQLGLNFRLSDLTFIKFAAYYVSQTFANPQKTKYIIPTNKPGEYTSLMSFTNHLETVNYGVTVGLTFGFISYTQYDYNKTFKQAEKMQ